MRDGAGAAGATCLLTGRANAGKTLLALALFGELGRGRLSLDVTRPDGRRESRSGSLAAVRRSLVGNEPFTTRNLQTQVVQLGRWGRVSLRIVDGAALAATVHEDHGVRQGQAQVVEALPQARVILHVIDAAAGPGTAGAGDQAAAGDAAAAGDGGAADETDASLSWWAKDHPGYAIIANKIDLPRAQAGLKRLKQQFPTVRIIPVSAFDRRGFRELKAFLYERARSRGFRA